MARGSSIHRFALDVSDLDRGVYETLDLRVALHPSESAPYMVTRLLGYVLNLQEGLAFSRGGLSSTEDPALFVDDLTGHRTVWIEVGQPSADRLHKASKAAKSVRVYVHKTPGPWLRQLEGQTIFRAEEIEVFLFDPAFLDALADRLVRNNTWAILFTENTLYVTIGEETIEGTVTPACIQ